MSLSTRTVLVEIAEETPPGEAISKGRLAERLAVPKSALEQPIERLCECGLLKATEGGLRPTVTARELLALDVDFDEFLVLDVVEE